MELLRILLSRCATLLRRQTLDEDLDEELRTHIDFAIEEHLKQGMSEEKARTIALREFGGVTQIKETYRVQRGFPFMETVIRDIRYALRQLRRSPGFAITVILTLALGIGANVVVFSALNTLVLRPFDVPQATNLFQIVHRQQGWDSHSYRDYVDYRDRDPSLNGLMAYHILSAGLQTGKSTMRSWGYVASGNYF